MANRADEHEQEYDLTSLSASLQPGFPQSRCYRQDPVILATPLLIYLIPQIPDPKFQAHNFSSVTTLANQPPISTAPPEKTLRTDTAKCTVEAYRTYPICELLLSARSPRSHEHWSSRDTSRRVVYELSKHCPRQSLRSVSVFSVNQSPKT